MRTVPKRASNQTMEDNSLTAWEVLKALYVGDIVRDKDLKARIPFSRSEVGASLHSLIGKGLIEVKVGKKRFKAYSLTSEGRQHVVERMRKTLDELMEVVRQLENPLEAAELFLAELVLKRLGDTHPLTGVELPKALAKELVRNWLKSLLQQAPGRISRSLQTIEHGEGTAEG